MWLTPIVRHLPASIRLRRSLLFAKATRLTHHREYDTHPAIELQPGMYEFRTGREFDPFEEAIRISAD